MNQDAHIISAEQLSSEQRQQVQELVRLSGQSGVLVSMMQGSAAWDQRPLILDQGALNLIRFSAPDLSTHSERYRHFAALCRRLGSISSISGVKASGENSQRIWVKRRFYRQVLSEAIQHKDQSILGDLPAVFRTLIKLLRTLHQEGLVHGHISADNVGVAEEGGASSLYLLDHGFILNAEIQTPAGFGLAPEIQSGAQPAMASDVYGLGTIYRMASKDPAALEGFSSEQCRLLEDALSDSPMARPPLSRFEDLFLERPSGYHTIMSSGGGVAGINVRAGRLMMKDVRVLEGLSEVQGTSEQPALKVLKPLVPSSQFAELSGALLQRIKLPRDARFWVAAAAVLCFVLYAALRSPGSGLDIQDPLAEWTSDQPSRMEAVARAAIQGGSDQARSIIVGDALAGHVRPQVFSSIIKNAFNPLWERELSESDRALVLGLALGELVPEGLGSLSALSEAHPGVVMAVAGSINSGNAPLSLQGVKTAALASLPAPYGEAFESLDRIGVKALGDKEALAFCRLVQGDLKESAIRAYLGGDSSSMSGLARLAILLPFLRKDRSAGAAVYDALRGGGGLVADAVHWFEVGEGAAWNSVEKSARLSMLCGILPEEGLHFEHYADLLAFPVDMLRKVALRGLAAQSGENGPQVMGAASVLLSPANYLTREQSLTLLLALKAPGASGEAMVSTWFKTEPDSRTVLALLLERKSIVRDDAFNLEASRYLAGTPWVASTEQLKALASHPEAVARALAVSRLDLDKREELAVLKAMSSVEPVESLRNKIREKLLTVFDE